MPHIWISLDTSNPATRPIIDAALKAVLDGATGMTITSSDAGVMEIPPRSPAEPPAGSPPPVVIAGDAEVDVRTIWGHLYSGKFSRTYLKIAAKYCEDNDTEVFTFGDLDTSEFENGISGIRAAHRNVSRAMADEGAQLFKKKWDTNKGCQSFTLSKAYREAILNQAAADSDL